MGIAIDPALGVGQLYEAKLTGRNRTCAGPLPAEGDAGGGAAARITEV